jgi:hypothetical protein
MLIPRGYCASVLHFRCLTCGVPHTTFCWAHNPTLSPHSQLYLSPLSSPVNRHGNRPPPRAATGAAPATHAGHRCPSHAPPATIHRASQWHPPPHAPAPIGSRRHTTRPFCGCGRTPAFRCGETRLQRQSSEKEVAYLLPPSERRC